MKAKGAMKPWLSPAKKPGGCAHCWQFRLARTTSEHGHSHTHQDDWYQHHFPLAPRGSMVSGRHLTRAFFCLLHLLRHSCQSRHTRLLAGETAFGNPLGGQVVFSVAEPLIGPQHPRALGGRLDRRYKGQQSDHESPNHRLAHASSPSHARLRFCAERAHVGILQSRLARNTATRKASITASSIPRS
jgi:hypothetical protein